MQGLSFVVNTNSDIFLAEADKTFDPRDENRWVKSSSLKADWVQAEALLTEISILPDDESWKDVRASLPCKKVPAGAILTVFCSETSAVARLGWGGEINAMVTDIDMPGNLNGLDLAQLVYRSRSKAAIIVTSGGRAVDDSDIPLGCFSCQSPIGRGDILAILSRKFSDATFDADVRLVV